MSLGALLDDKLGNVIPARGDARSRILLDALVDSGRMEVVIVTGEFDDRFYSYRIGSEILNAVLRGSKVSVLLKHKVEGNLHDSVAALIRVNRLFFDALSDGMKTLSASSERVFGDIHFYLSARRAKNHFAIIDQSVFIESQHQEGAPRSVYVKRDSKYFSNKYRKVFEGMIANPIVDHVSGIQVMKQYREIVNVD